MLVSKYSRKRFQFSHRDRKIRSLSHPNAELLWQVTIKTYYKGLGTGAVGQASLCFAYLCIVSMILLLNDLSDEFQEAAVE